MKRTILAAGAATVLAGATLVGTAFAGTTAAAAATSTESVTNSWASRNAAVHNAPSLDAPVSTVLTAGSRVDAICVWVDPNEHDKGKAIWFRIATHEEGGGWVPRDALGGVPSLPAC